MPLEILLYHNRVVVARVGASAGYKGSTGELCFWFVGFYNCSQSANRVVTNRKINYMATPRWNEPLKNSFASDPDSELFLEVKFQLPGKFSSSFPPVPNSTGKRFKSRFQIWLPGAAVEMQGGKSYFLEGCAGFVPSSPGN